MASSNSENRPAIPANIKRQILVEAGHRCAIPTCRHIEVDVHHIVPWSQCKAHEYENLIALCPNCHRRANRGEIDRKSLRLYKFNLRFAHDKFSQLEMDILFELYNGPPDTGIPWMPFMHILLKRTIDANLIEIHPWSPPGVSVQSSVMGVRTNPDMLVLTSSGREFLNDLGVTSFSEESGDD